MLLTTHPVKLRAVEIHARLRDAIHRVSLRPVVVGEAREMRANTLGVEPAFVEVAAEGVGSASGATEVSLEGPSGEGSVCASEAVAANASRFLAAIGCQNTWVSGLRAKVTDRGSQEVSEML